MKIQELRQFTRETVQRAPGKAWANTLLLPVVWMSMKLLPDLLFVFSWENHIMTSRELFFGSNPFWAAFLILWELLSFCILTPIVCGVCSWFSSMLGFRKKPVHAFRDRKIFWQGMRFFGTLEILKFFVVFPFVLACVLTVGAFRKSLLQEDAGFWLFLVVQCLCLCIWTAVFAIRFWISLLATPLLFLENPRCKVWQTVKLSGKILEHQYQKLGLIFISNYNFRNMFMMLVLFLQIRIREYLQEQEKY